MNSCTYQTYLGGHKRLDEPFLVHCPEAHQQKVKDSQVGGLEDGPISRMSGECRKTEGRHDPEDK
jgi:hypothetical protein